MKFYSVNEIMSLHKFAFYGNAERFKNFVETNELVQNPGELIDQFFPLLYIIVLMKARKKNFEFAKYILNNYDFIDIKYKQSITATYLKYGVYDKKLHTEDYNFNLYGGFPKSSVEKLIEYVETHKILSMIITVNNWPEYKEKIKKIDEFKIKK
uniref:Uncharacterized protein n=1 Tax=Pichia etchellsii TaxID=28550 RepID=Q9C129_PICET|nr:hypothetical protein [Schwanniomyces etchellsii]